MHLLFEAPATTYLSSFSLHDALPISGGRTPPGGGRRVARRHRRGRGRARTRRPARPRVPPAPPARDRKSTRLNSSHTVISYAVFCLKKKKTLEIFVVVHRWVRGGL